MALVSMTGFGRGQASAAGVGVEVELGTVNRKQFDARINLPRSVSVLEPLILPVLREKISRGQISLTVRVTAIQKAGARPSLDRDVARRLLRELRETAAVLKLPDDLSAASLLALPNVFENGETVDARCDADTVWPVLEKALRAALRDLVKMRNVEGATLSADLDKRLSRLAACRARIGKRAPGVPARHKRALLARLSASGLTIDLADPSFQRELLIFADRSDISEELVRLESHMDQFATLLVAKKPVGRTLDFICQEMFREVNTIGSKANDGRISTWVIQFKADLEAIREQVQNVE
jgi:uncharacterized protein (TIGR00255 family)